MHKTQKELLRRLFLKSNQKYSLLTCGFNYDDNIVFHLKQLVSKNFIKKKDDRYLLTEIGIRKIKEYDQDTLDSKSYKTFLIGILCTDGNSFVLKDHPNAENNFYNLPSGMPEFGEKIEDAIQRIFYEKTRLKIDPNRFAFVSTHLKTVVNDKDLIIFDDVFIIFKLDLDLVEKKKAVLRSDLFWFTKDEILKLENKWFEIDLCVFKEKPDIYKSYTIKSNYIL